jgi:hypothetical protein
MIEAIYTCDQCGKKTTTTTISSHYSLDRLPVGWTLGPYEEETHFCSAVCSNKWKGSLSKWKEDKAKAEKEFSLKWEESNPPPRPSR